jgi:hypothetical protein
LTLYEKWTPPPASKSSEIDIDVADKDRGFAAGIRGGVRIMEIRHAVPKRLSNPNSVTAADCTEFIDRLAIFGYGYRKE